MAFPDNIDFDKLMNALLDDVSISIRGWISGRVLEEVALMNRITEQLSRGRRGCDVGVSSPVTMRCEVAVLHRKGIKQVDRYGSDLAVTVYVDDSSFVKTALFQLKKSEDLNLKLERKQLEDAVIDARTKNRAFVLAVDETRHVIRLHDVDRLLSTYDEQETKTFRSNQWESLTRWTWEWLSCNIGEPSVLNSANSVEDLLREFVEEESSLSQWERRELTSNLPENYLPAKVWLQLFFEPKSTQS